MITDYTTLKAAIASWLKRDDLTDSIPLFIQLYEAQVNRELMNMNPPHYALETTLPGTFVNNSSSPFLLALPTGYKGTRRFQVLQGGNYRTLTYKTPQQIAEYYTIGQPRFYTTNSGYLEVAPSPDDDTDYKWQYLAPLASVSIGSNWLIENAPDLYLYGSLIHSAPFLKNDARIATWVSMHSKLMDDLELNNTRYHQSGSTLQQRSDSAL